MAPAITVRETMIVVRRAGPVKVQVASVIATTGPPPGVARRIAVAAPRARSAAAGVRPAVTTSGAGARTGPAGAGTSVARSVVVVPAGPVVRTADRSADSDRPGLVVPVASATTAVGGRTAGVARGPTAVRAIAATIAAAVRQVAAHATIGEPATTAATGAGTTAVTTDVTTAVTTDVGTTEAGTTGRPQDAPALTAPTVMRVGRIDRTVARSVTIAVVPEIGTVPATTAEAETGRVTAGTTEATEGGTARTTDRARPDTAAERAPRATPPPTALSPALIEALSGRTIAVDTTATEAATGRTTADTGVATAADRITARAIVSVATARPTPVGTRRAHRADTRGTTERGAVRRIATDRRDIARLIGRRDTVLPIGRRDIGRTTADPAATDRAAVPAPPPGTAQAVTGGGSTVTGRAGIVAATSGAAGIAVRTPRTEARRAEAEPETATRPDGTTRATVRRRIAPTIADPGVPMAAGTGATMHGALVALPHRVVDPVIARTGSVATRRTSAGPPAPVTTVERRTGTVTCPHAPRPVAWRSAGPVTRPRAKIAAMPTRSGSRRRRSPTT